MATKTSQHTPGPWTNQRKGGEAFICGRSVHVASVPIVDEQDEANARLIAAAPEMLSFIRDIARMAEDNTCACDDGTCFVCVAVRLRQEIER